MGYAALVRKKKYKDFLFYVLGILSLFAILMILLLLMVDLARTGSERLDFNFLSSFPSRFASKAGILPALVGSLCVMIVTALVAIPIGIASGIYLEEYAPKSFFSSFIELNIINLAGIPSIIFGLMSLGIFVHQLQWGPSIATGGITLGLLVLPIVIVSTREAIRTIPKTMREASFALGSSRWQTIWNHILPYSSGGIMTGVIIALSRAIGETAPLLTIGAVAYIAYLPPSPLTHELPFLNFQWMKESFTAMPIQMFNWVSRPQDEFHVNAAAAGIILLAMTLSMNMFAIIIRYRFRKKMKW